MLKRDRSSLPRAIGCYDCGFPCQPFSLLHNNSSLMGEAEVEVFREAMRTIYKCEPLVSVLENVVGILRCWSSVEKYLNRQRAYLYCRLLIDPCKLGECVSRRRVYILLIHKFLAELNQSHTVLYVFGVVIVSLF